MMLLLLTKRTAIAFLFLSFFITLLFVYFPVFQYGYTGWDDIKIVRDNPALSKATRENLEQILLPGRIQEEQLYTPVPYLSFLAERLFFSLNPKILHFNNFILHFINCFLACIVIFRLAKSFLIAFLCMLIFAFHPIQVESVAWIAGRKELLYSFFSFLSILIWLKWLDKKNYLILLGAFFILLLALLSKPSAMILPGILTILMIRKFLLEKNNSWQENQTPDNELLYMKKDQVGVFFFEHKKESGLFQYVIAVLPFFLLAGIVYVINNMIAYDAPGQNIRDMLFRAKYLPDILVGTFKRLFLLAPCSPFYFWRTLITAGISINSFFICIFLLLFLFFDTLKNFSRRTFFAWSYLISILPLIFLVVFSYRDFYTADRYSYFPILWFTAFIFTFLRDSKTCIIKMLLFFGFPIFLLLCISQSSHQVKIWEKSQTLWEYTLQLDPDCVVARHNLGNFLFRQGEYRKAAEHFIVSFRISGLPDSAFNYALCHEMIGELDVAEKYYKISFAKNQKYIKGRLKLISLLERQGRKDEAHIEYLKALEAEQ